MRLTPRRLLLLACLAFVPAAPVASARAQEPTRPVFQPTAPGKTQRLSLKDGSELVGRIVSVDSTSLQFESAIGVSTISLDAVIAVKDESGQVRDGRYYFANPNATRLIFAPTGRMLPQGEGYISDFWIFFPSFATGLTNRLTFGAGMSILPGVDFDKQIFFVTPKVGIVQGERFNAAVGALAIAVPTFDDNSDRESAGLLYGVGTWGSTDQSFTAGVGYGYVGGTLSDTPVFMFGGDVRVAPRVSLVTENYFFSDGGLISGGVRFMGPGISVDLALSRPFSGGEGATIPLVGFMWKW